MKTRVLFLVGCCMISALHSQSQSTPQMLDNLKTVIPPSPTAASLGKYAAWPISLYTGTAGVNIPVYELKGRSISVPVSLNYHASSLRVGETASWVGLGWSLDAGGVITRALRGLPDDDPYAGYLTIRQEYANPGDLASGTTPHSTDSANMQQAVQGLLDAEPDVYSLNAMGKSYKLIFSGTGKIITAPYSNLKITCNWSDSTWKVVLEDGTILNFGGGHFVEITDNDKISGNPAYDFTQFMSSWYLRSIVTTTGETINFTYTSSYITQNTSISQVDYMYNNYNGPGQPTFATCNGECGGQTLQIPGLTNSSSVQSVTTCNLSTIESELTRLEFVPDTVQRTDLPGGYALDSIKVFSKLSGKYIKKFALLYNYSTATSSQTGAVCTACQYRLKLSTFKEVPIDKSIPQTWQFAYNPTSLPSRTSYAQDYWGYYNGHTSNTTFLPQVVTTQAVSGSFTAPTYVVGVRDPDSASMQAEILTQVTYPTGGTTQFNYSPNSYPGFVMGHQTTIVSANIREDSVHLSPLITSIKDTFYINSPQSVTINTTSYFSPPYQADNAPFSNSVLGSVYIQNLHNPSIGSGANFTGSGGSNMTTIFLDTGTYVYGVSTTADASSLQPPFPPNYYAKMSSSFGYSTDTGLRATTIPAGGVRIRSQVIKDGVDSTKNQYISYTYSNPFVIAPLDVENEFITTLSEQLKTQVGGGTDCDYYLSNCFQNYLVRHSVSKESLGSVQGGTVGYGTVRTTYGVNGENGYTISQFSNQGDENQSAAARFPYPAVCVVDWRRGLLLQQADYTAAGTLLKKQVENYQFGPSVYIHGFKTGTLIKYNDAQQHGQSNVVRIDENVKAEQVKHAYSVATVYNTVTGDSLVSTTYNYYDDSLNMQPVRMVSFNSKGDSVLVYNRTALEKTAINASMTLSGAASTAIDSMTARNMVAIPVQSEKYVKGVLTSKMLTNYKLQGSGWVMPDNVVVQVASNTPETRVSFSRYNSNGTLSEQLKTSDAKHNYIWDYQTNYAIAETTNADSASIAYTSFEADGKGNWTIASSSRDTTAGITGSRSYVLSSDISKSGLSSSQTYFVSYWTQNTSAFSINGTLSNFPVKGKTINGWTFYLHKVTGQTTISLTGSGHIDELRLYPAAAQMTTYTYTPLVGITSQCDMDNRITRYEYDGFQRLLRIRDQDYNILKQYDYQYQTSNRCGANCYILPGQTAAGTNMLGYPVGVFDVHGKLLGNATGATRFVTLWNADTADSRIGTLAVSNDSLHFNLTLNSGMTLPSGVTGMRYYQADLAWNNFDGLRNSNAAYIDYGDGTGMHLPGNATDTASPLAPNTTYGTAVSDNALMCYYVHTYPDSTLKTLTFYHNDSLGSGLLDNLNNPANSLIRIKNLRGNLPQNMKTFGGSCYQQATMNTVDSIRNWNSISSIQYFGFNKGDQANPCKNLHYAQDFMKNNKGLIAIRTTGGIYVNGYRDTTFKISRLKSDWNTYFTGLQTLLINDDYWNREDLSALTQLNTLAVVATTQNHQDDVNSPLIPIPSATIDAILNQVAAGAGQTVSNGVLTITSGGSTRTSASDAAVATLTAKGWTITLN